VTAAIEHCVCANIRFVITDPKYEDEVSGCTACVGLITGDKIFIVSPL